MAGITYTVNWQKRTMRQRSQSGGRALYWYSGSCRGVSGRQTVLDIGIGTGLGSEPFFRAGLRITGMDVSDTMLAVYRKKGFAERLVCHDLTHFPYLSLTVAFDHVISTGVFPFLPRP